MICVCALRVTRSKAISTGIAISNTCYRLRSLVVLACGQRLIAMFTSTTIPSRHPPPDNQKDLYQKDYSNVATLRCPLSGNAMRDKPASCARHKINFDWRLYSRAGEEGRGGLPESVRELSWDRSPQHRGRSA